MTKWRDEMAAALQSARERSKIEAQAREMPSDDDLVRRGDVFAVVQYALEQEADNLRFALHVGIADLPALSLPSVEIRREAWQPIETVPRGGVVLVWAHEYNSPVVAKTNDAGEAWEGDWEYQLQATHWQPLPEPPVALSPSKEEERL